MATAKDLQALRALQKVQEFQKVLEDLVHEAQRHAKALEAAATTTGDGEVANSADRLLVVTDQLRAAERHWQETCTEAKERWAGRLRGPE